MDKIPLHLPATRPPAVKDLQRAVLRKVRPALLARGSETFAHVGSFEALGVEAEPGEFEPVVQRIFRPADGAR
jgi:hypothetical protein